MSVTRSSMTRNGFLEGPVVETDATVLGYLVEHGLPVLDPLPRIRRIGLEPASHFGRYGSESRYRAEYPSSDGFPIIRGVDHAAKEEKCEIRAIPVQALDRPEHLAQHEALFSGQCSPARPFGRLRRLTH
jgi:hypothetical protein